MKRLAKSILFWPSLAWLRMLFWLKDAGRDSRATDIKARLYGYQTLKDAGSLFERADDSDTLFILGSGSSVLDLTDKNFELIKRHRSIGINMWAVHPFVPDVYSLEYSKDEDFDSESWTGLETLLNREAVRKKGPAFFHLRPPVVHQLLRRYRLGSEGDSRSVMYGRLNVLGGGPINLSRDLEKLVSAEERGLIPGNVLPDNGASVVRLIFLGLRKGFRRIVLVGIDLDERPYFWHDERFTGFSLELTRQFPRPSGAPHTTNETADRPFPTDMVLRELAVAIENRTQTRVYVGSHQSSLADSLPVFCWE